MSRQARVRRAVALSKPSVHAVVAVVVALALGVTAACGGGPRPEASPAPAEPAPAAPGAAPAAPTAAPAAAPALEPSAEQLPLADDFSAQADQEITASNYRTQLDALEREILAETKPQ
jgi:hypothetical protein